MIISYLDMEGEAFSSLFIFFIPGIYLGKEDGPYTIILHHHKSLTRRTFSNPDWTNIIHA